MAVSSLDNRIFTGVVRPEDLDDIGTDYLNFVEAKFSGTFDSRTFYEASFLRTSFSAIFKNINFNYATVVQSNLASGVYSNVEFRNSQVIRSHLPVNMSGLKGINPVAIAEGDIIGYKKLRDNRIATLIIPRAAKRSTAGFDKCRAEYAIVASIEDRYGKSVDEGYSNYDTGFRYSVGAIVKPDYSFHTNPWNECASGIHFFLTRKDAEAWCW